MEAANDGARLVTRILRAAAAGEPRAAAELLPLVYDELRKLAASRIARLAPGQTLQATALVHEAYLRLAGDGDPGWNGRGHFFGAAARAIRDILVEQARRKASLRHGGAKRADADLDDLPIALEEARDLDLLALDEALKRLEADDARKARIVELRTFAGLEHDAIAGVLGVSTRTVEREWKFARSWLQREMARGDGA